MIGFVLKRIFGAVVTLFVIITLSFFMMRLAPGGPFSKDRNFPPEVLENIKKKYDLDKPLLVQYGLYIKRIVVDFDLGPSTRYSDRSVNELVGDGFMYSLKVGLGALIVALMLGLISGLLAALNHNKFLDYFPMSLSMVGISIPDFVLANLLVLVLTQMFFLLPAAGVDSLAGYVIPCFTLGLIYASSISRLTRGGMLEILSQDFVRTAKAKGLSGSTILWKHSLKGGLLPVVSYLGPATAGMFTGGLVVEKICFIPGLGKLFIESAINRDYTLSMGCVIVYAVLILIFNLIVDLVYGLLDPRVAYE
jgi:oligopeptide transport system permease protein